MMAGQPCGRRNRTRRIGVLLNRPTGERENEREGPAERDPAGSGRSGRPAGSDRGSAMIRLATLGGPVNIRGVGRVPSTTGLRGRSAFPTFPVLFPWADPERMRGVENPTWIIAVSTV